MKSFLVLIPSFFFLFCEGPSNSNESTTADTERLESFSEMSPAMKSAPRPELIQSEEEPQTITKKNIKTGGITFKSNDIDADYNRITALLPGFQAYVENENQTKTDQRVQYDLSIRVPSEKYDSLYNRLSSLAERVEHKYTNLQDVTERYYDLQTRIKNKKALEQRYLDLLAKASAVKDMLEIESQLNEVRTEIENLQGQFNYLSNQVSFSTLQLTVYEVLPYTYDDSQRPGFGNRILSALNNGWQGMQLFVLGLITIWPLYVFIALVILIVMLARRWWRRRK